MLFAENGSPDGVEAEVGPGRLSPPPPMSSPEMMSEIQFHASLPWYFMLSTENWGI
jgi:hypothetical protein